jgi:hypothetical protein
MGALSLIRRQSKSPFHCIGVSFAKRIVGDVLLERLTILYPRSLNRSRTDGLGKQPALINAIDGKAEGAYSY